MLVFEFHSSNIIILREKRKPYTLLCKGAAPKGKPLLLLPVTSYNLQFEGLLTSITILLKCKIHLSDLKPAKNAMYSLVFRIQQILVILQKRFFCERSQQDSSTCFLVHFGIRNEFLATHFVSLTCVTIHSDVSAAASSYARHSSSTMHSLIIHSYTQ